MQAGRHADTKTRRHTRCNVVNRHEETSLPPTLSLFLSACGNRVHRAACRISLSRALHICLTVSVRGVGIKAGAAHHLGVPSVAGNNSRPSHSPPTTAAPSMAQQADGTRFLYE
jgi:hypothetical protein